MIILLSSSFKNYANLGTYHDEVNRSKKGTVLRNHFLSKVASFYFPCNFLTKMKMSSKKIIANPSQELDDRNLSL